MKASTAFTLFFLFLSGNIVLPELAAQQILSTLGGSAAGDVFGKAVRRFSDTDGDGINDWLVSAIGSPSSIVYSPNTLAVGTSYVEIRSEATGSVLTTMLSPLGLGVGEVFG